LGGVEFLACFVAVYIGYWTRLELADLGGRWSFTDLFPSALIYASLIFLCMNAMGVYQAMTNEGRVGTSVRTIVAFLLGSLIFPVFYYFLGDIFGLIWRSVLLLTSFFAVFLILVSRSVFFRFVNRDGFKRKVLVLGTGRRARGLLQDLNKPSDWKGIKLDGFFPFPGDHVQIDQGIVKDSELSLPEYAINNDIDEIVVAVDDRRKKLPLEQLMICRAEGIKVIQEHEFIEREARKIAVGVISPGWFIFSEGFRGGLISNLFKRLFDVTASLILLIVSWPVMLITVLAIWIEEGFSAPLLYKQIRVGLNNQPFEVFKFRSMRTDAEKPGQPVWAAKNDARVTRVGAKIRKYRIDELPQLFNVLFGDMAFVGPRPERPVFVEKLAESIPFYNERHRVKPGITGWAQLCFNYADDVEGSKEKLRYDLYYIKNSSLLLDILILLQTVEIVVFKKGAH